MLESCRRAKSHANPSPPFRIQGASRHLRYPCCRLHIARELPYRTDVEGGLTTSLQVPLRKKLYSDLRRPYKMAKFSHIAVRSYANVGPSYWKTFMPISGLWWVGLVALFGSSGPSPSSPAKMSHRVNLYTSRRSLLTIRCALTECYCHNAIIVVRKNPVSDTTTTRMGYMTTP